MTWLRQNWIALLVVGAVALSFAASRKDRIDAGNATHATLIQGCQRSSYQKAMGAIGWDQASNTRRAQGDLKPAATYEAVAEGMLATIPAPPGYRGSRLLMEARLVARPVPHYVLSPRAQELHREGCERVF